MKHEATTIEDYINNLADDRKEAISRLMQLLREKLPQGFEENISYGMPSFVVPHSLYPAGYHCDPKQALPFISLASQKNHIAIYHMGLYADKALMQWFTDSWSNFSTHKPDMGKSCIRFKNMQKIPYELFAELFRKMSPQAWIALYEQEFVRK